MQLSKIELKNFRLLHDVSVRVGQPGTSTILVGPNNSGKTSVAEALLLFTRGHWKELTISDFSIASRAAFDLSQVSFLAQQAEGQPIPTLTPPPSIALTMHFTYSDDNDDLAVATDLLMDLNLDSKTVALRIKFAPRDVAALRTAYLTDRDNNESLHSFLGRTLHEHYEPRFYKVAPLTGESEVLPEAKIVDRAILVDFIQAQRHMSDSPTGPSTRLSGLLHKHYTRHFADMDEVGHAELEKSLRGHSEDLTTKYTGAIAPLLAALTKFGYPQKQTPRLSVRAELRAETLFKDNTTAYYTADVPSVEGVTPTVQELPEKYNGLGFKNLIYIILQIRSFRDAYEQWDGVRPRAHLIMVEEPEVHLHPQMQSVFIKQILPFLDAPGAITRSQLLLTTHSSHIVADSGFDPIRYFRRKGSVAEAKDLTVFKEKQELSEGPGAVAFLSEYMTQTRCDLFFADKAILFEGSVERLLLPAMIRLIAVGNLESMLAEYLSFIEVGGAYAHRFRPLLEFLGLPALVITDLDAIGADGKKCKVASGTRTSNATLKKWIPAKESLADLQAASDAQRTVANVRIAYQVPEGAPLTCGRSFEEAFIYKNAEWLFTIRASLEGSSSALECGNAADLRARAYDITSKDFQKVDFALDLMLHPGWSVPKYIADGLVWLAGQST